jgi:hypothetical protein
LKNENNVLFGWVIVDDNYIKLNRENYKSPLQLYIKNKFMVDSVTRLEQEKNSAVKIYWKSLLP